MDDKAENDPVPLPNVHAAIFKYHDFIGTPPQG
jgi:hypothetical protein